MKVRSFSFTCFALVGFFVQASSASADCTDFRGLWDDQDFRVWTVSPPSGGNFTGVVETGCGPHSFSGNVGGGGSGVINLFIPDSCQGPGYYSSAFAPSGAWTAHCDQVVLTILDYDPQGQQIGAPYSATLITYAESETSNTSVFFPDWIGSSYVWKATATTTAIGRSFGGRSFFEADNTSAPDDNCWWSGLPTSLRYDSLNKGGGGPFPNINNWLTLDAANSWNDKVGWGDVYWVTYYRQNSPTVAASGTCRAIVGQTVDMVSDWGGGLWGYRPYKNNSHVITIWNANDATYSAGRQGSNDWHFGSARDAQVRTKFWPILDSPTNLAFGSVTSTSIQFSWTGTPGDGDGFSIWRSTDGVNYAAYATSSTASYTDTGVTSGQRYYYYVRARLSGGNGAVGPTGAVNGPHSDAISTTTP